MDQTLLEASRYPADTVRLKAEEWQGYQKRFPQLVEKKIPLAIDEYAYFNFGAGGGPFAGENLKQALAYAMVLNEMARYTEFLTMGAQTTGVSLIDFNKTASTLNGLGLVYKMYGDHFVGAIPVALSGNSPQPAPKYPAGSPDQPEKSSGSPTYPARHVRGIQSRSQISDRLRRQCDPGGAKGRCERHRCASARPLHSVAIDRRQKRTPSTMSDSRPSWQSSNLHWATLRRRSPLLPSA